MKRTERWRKSSIADLKNHRAQRFNVQYLKNGVNKVAQSTRKIFDNKKYKTKTMVEEFWDSLQFNQVLTKTFDKRVRKAFEAVDIDNSGAIDKTELYAGILLLYHNINMIPWGGRKPPPTRQFVMELFDSYMDEQKKTTGDENATELTYATFELLCTEHFEVVIGSVVFRILLIAIVFPFVGLYLTDLLLRTPIGNSIKHLEEELPTFFMTILVFGFPYVEAIVMRRVFADKGGFGQFSVTPGGFKLKE